VPIQEEKLRPWSRTMVKSAMGAQNTLSSPPKFTAAPLLLDSRIVSRDSVSGDPAVTVPIPDSHSSPLFMWYPTLAPSPKADTNERKPAIGPPRLSVPVPVVTLVSNTRSAILIMTGFPLYERFSQRWNRLNG